MSIVDEHPVPVVDALGEVDVLASGDTWALAVVDVTPELAHALLQTNRRNRNLRGARTSHYAEQMRRGEWREAAGEPLYIESGELTNGQHRLSAQVEVDRSIKYVVRLSTDSVQYVADAGLARRFADTLKLRGDKDASVLAAAVRLVVTYERIGRMASGSLGAQALGLSTPYLLKRLDEDYDGFRAAVPKGRRPRALGVPLRDSVGVALYYLLSKADESDADVFFDLLSTGANLDAHDPIFLLRRQLNNLQTRAAGRSSIPSEHQAALTIKAFNVWRRGETIGVLRWRGGGAEREPFPEIERLYEAEGD